MVSYPTKPGTNKLTSLTGCRLELGLLRVVNKLTNNLQMIRAYLTGFLVQNPLVPGSAETVKGASQVHVKLSGKRLNNG